VVDFNLVLPTAGTVTQTVQPTQSPTTASPGA
jgi:hypothetical protein